MSNQKRFQILSLDGGGIKGIFSAAVLANIEEDLGIEIQDHFDLIAGTSTGGIIALGLGLGMRPAEILQFYLDNGRSIFNRPCIKWLKHFFLRKYSNRNLEKALRKCFLERKLGESKKRLVITSYSMTSNDICLFRTPHCSHLVRDYKLPLVNIALSTSAAPTYLPVYRGLDGNRLVDGGVWANNPVMVAITEAVGFLKSDLKDIFVFSLGTTAPIKKRRSFLNWGGLILWAKYAADLIMDGQSLAATKQAQNLLGEDHVLRINPIVTDGEFSLDGVSSAQELIAKASHESRKITPSFKKLFAEHKASEYVPLFKS